MTRLPLAKANQPKNKLENPTNICGYYEKLLIDTTTTVSKFNMNKNTQEEFNHMFEQLKRIYEASNVFAFWLKKRNSNCACRKRNSTKFDMHKANHTANIANCVENNRNKITGEIKNNINYNHNNSKATVPNCKLKHTNVSPKKTILNRRRANKQKSLLKTGGTVLKTVRRKNKYGMSFPKLKRHSSKCTRNQKTEIESRVQDKNNMLTESSSRGLSPAPSKIFPNAINAKPPTYSLLKQLAGYKDFSGNNNSQLYNSNNANTLEYNDDNDDNDDYDDYDEDYDEEDLYTEELYCVKGGKLVAILPPPAKDRTDFSYSVEEEEASCSMPSYLKEQYNYKLHNQPFLSGKADGTSYASPPPSPPLSLPSLLPPSTPLKHVLSLPTSSFSDFPDPVLETTSTEIPAVNLVKRRRNQYEDEDEKEEANTKQKKNS